MVMAVFKNIFRLTVAIRLVPNPAGLLKKNGMTA